MTMVTDPQRMRRSDPGNPDICNVFTMHKIFSSAEEVGMVNVECRRAGIGCVDCKKLMARNMNKALEPFRERRIALAGTPKACGMCSTMARAVPAQLPRRRWSRCAQQLGWRVGQMRTVLQRVKAGRVSVEGRRSPRSAAGW